MRKRDNGLAGKRDTHKVGHFRPLEKFSHLSVLILSRAAAATELVQLLLLYGPSDDLRHFPRSCVMGPTSTFRPRFCRCFGQAWHQGSGLGVEAGSWCMRLLWR